MLLPDASSTMARPCEEAARDLVDGWKRFADSSQTIPELETRLYRWSIEGKTVNRLQNFILKHHLNKFN